MTGSSTTSSPTPYGVISPWPVDRPAVRVFLFHHAGGTHRFFRNWAGLFPADWEVLLMEAPGRGAQAAHPACEDLGDLVELFHDRIRTLLDRPYGFFGHSMGGLVCTELGRRLRRTGPGPRWMGLSAWAADQGNTAGARTDRSLLPDSQLRALVATLGGAPPEILENEALWRLLSPVIRRDFRLLDSSDPALHAPVEGIPLSLFGGESDAMLPVARLATLARRQSRPPRLHLHPGGHFYLRERRREVARQITADLTAALRGHAS